eukprot:1618286-Pyramimonas_sp.AAC.1
MPEWQGKGYGLKLVRYLLSKLRDGNRIDDVGPSSFAVSASIIRLYPPVLRPIGRRNNIPARPASDWSVT